MLDLSGKKGLAFTQGTFPNFSTLVHASFDGGNVNDADKFIVKVDTSSGDVSANALPAAMRLADGVTEAFVEGAEVTLVKVTPDANKITFMCPMLGINYAHVNQPGESITLVLDANNGAPRWVSKP